MMATVLITGGTGMIGSSLAKELVRRGHRAVVLTRRNEPPSENVTYRKWNVERGTIDEAAVREADFIVHLAGANVADGRWTAARKKEILDSRVNSGALLVKALQTIPNRVKAVIGASAIGWYGPDAQVPGSRPFVETDPADASFLGRTCAQWEAAIRPVEATGKRLVLFRIGIVLSNEGGAYVAFKKPLAFGAAAVLGSGKQVVSWIHADDLVGLFCKALEDETMAGVYNAVAPHPVSNKDLIGTMAKQRGGFSVPVPVPSFALKLALGEMSVEVLKSATVSAARVQAAGYQFLYPRIEDAVKQLESGGG